MPLNEREALEVNREAIVLPHDKGGLMVQVIAKKEVVIT